MFLHYSNAHCVTATGTKIICICLYQASSWHIFHAKTRFSLLLNQCLFQSMKIRSTITGYSQTSQDASQQSAENLHPQFRSPPR